MTITTGKNGKKIVTVYSMHYAVYHKNQIEKYLIIDEMKFTECAEMVKAPFL